jgi:hypothetical protein
MGVDNHAGSLLRVLGLDIGILFDFPDLLPLLTHVLAVAADTAPEPFLLGCLDPDGEVPRNT